MNQINMKKRLFIPPGRRRIPVSSDKGSFVISGEKIEIISLNRLKVSEMSFSENRLPTLQALERDYIKKVLSHVNDNRTRAAEILGIDRVSLWRKIKKHEITAPVDNIIEG